MKKALFVIFALTTLVAQATSNDVVENTTSKLSLQRLPLVRNQLGVGSPVPMITVGSENAAYVDDGYYHIPQYMPNYPTAGIIWPRVVEVECENHAGAVICGGYNWQPKFGRGEYLFVIPKMKTPTSIPVPVNIPPPIIVYREVPVKPKKQ